MTYTKKAIDDSCVRRLGVIYKDGGGASACSFEVGLDVSVSNSYHFKVYLLGNGFAGHYAEGNIAVYGGVTFSVNYKDPLITNLTYDVQTGILTIITNTNVYSGFISVTSGEDWVTCP